MIKIEDVINRIKDLISKEDQNNKKVFDKEVEFILCIPTSSLAKMRMRNSIPYDKILQFCIKKNISASWIFFGLGNIYINSQNIKKYRVIVEELLD